MAELSGNDEERKTMKRATCVTIFRLALLAMLVTAVNAQLVTEKTPGIPNVFARDTTAFQNQTHFLVFTGSDTAGENVKTATAYYNAIDPGLKNRTFPEWLVNTGFIQNTSQWHPTGPQIIACDLGPAAGCDVPAHNPDGSLNYGDNIVNTGSHVIVLNAADLGFVRNQFIRCVPSCSAPNPIIYTYLENYPVNALAGHGLAGTGSGFPSLTGYPTPAEAAAAIRSALNRPKTDPAGCVPDNTDTAFKCKGTRIADVAFIWGPPATSPTSSSRYGQLYAVVYNDPNPADPNSAITETIASPVAGVAPNVATRLMEPFNVGDPFPPNLDFIGFKQHPGVCFICHGGNPKNLTSTGAYPNQGKVSGFRYLPLDIRNLLFTSDLGLDQPATNGSVAFTDRANQELQIKVYNLTVLKTVPTGKSSDGTGATRVAHMREVIEGWYAGGRNTQDADFLPVAWREATHGGTAPARSEHLYTTVVAPFLPFLPFQPRDQPRLRHAREFQAGIGSFAVRLAARLQRPAADRV
jgi:hypothetical protein